MAEAPAGQDWPGSLGSCAERGPEVVAPQICAPTQLKLSKVVFPRLSVYPQEFSVVH
jgi:hypothetical protein